jgi:hypothetical protein
VRRYHARRTSAGANAAKDEGSGGAGAAKSLKGSSSAEETVGVALLEAEAGEVAASTAVLRASGAEALVQSV